MQTFVFETCLTDNPPPFTQSILWSDDEELQESQKPYRVFVSLLDEWDIGYPVIQAVFLDALLSLKRHVDAGHHGAEV